MKQLVIATGLALSLGLASIASAQPGVSGPGQSKERAEARMQMRVDRLSETLNLTDAQKIQIRALMDEQHNARRDLHQRHDNERKALREEHKSELAQILSTEQQAQWQQMHAERKQHSDGNRRGHGKRHGHGARPERRAPAQD